jgi:hypothetical protein
MMEAAMMVGVERADAAVVTLEHHRRIGAHSLGRNRNMTDEADVTEFRRRMESFRASREVEKQSHVALMDLLVWYSRLPARDRELANHVVAGWVLSANVTDRGDARTLVREFTITEARPNLLELKGKLEAASDVHARYELAEVTRVLDALGLGKSCGFTAIDPALTAWASRNGLHVLTQYRGEAVRSISLADAEGREFQVWIEREGDDFVVKASNNKHEEAARSWHSEPVAPKGVTSALDRAMIEVQTWIARA